jgi:hypothetical protein
MKPAAASVFAMTVFGLCLGLVGCERMPVGPSLSNVVVSGFTKQPTIDSQDPSLCCCRAVGTVTNRNSVPIYVSITLSALDARGNIISKAVSFAPDVAPGQTTQIIAPGFPVPCNAIAGFSPEVRVRGLTDPPL